MVAQSRPLIEICRNGNSAWEVTHRLPDLVPGIDQHQCLSPVQHGLQGSGRDELDAGLFKLTAPGRRLGLAGSHKACQAHQEHSAWRCSDRVRHMPSTARAQGRDEPEEPQHLVGRPADSPRLERRHSSQDRSPVSWSEPARPPIRAEAGLHQRARPEHTHNPGPRRYREPKTGCLRLGRVQGHVRAPRSRGRSPLSAGRDSRHCDTSAPG